MEVTVRLPRPLVSRPLPEPSVPLARSMRGREQIMRGKMDVEDEDWNQVRAWLLQPVQPTTLDCACSGMELDSLP